MHVASPDGEGSHVDTRLHNPSGRTGPLTSKKRAAGGKEFGPAVALARHFGRRAVNAIRLTVGSETSVGSVPKSSRNCFLVAPFICIGTVIRSPPGTTP